MGNWRHYKWARWGSDCQAILITEKGIHVPLSRRELVIQCTKASPNRVWFSLTHLLKVLRFRKPLNFAYIMVVDAGIDESVGAPRAVEVSPVKLINSSIV